MNVLIYLFSTKLSIRLRLSHVLNILSNLMNVSYLIRYQNLAIFSSKATWYLRYFCKKKDYLASKDILFLLFSISILPCHFAAIPYMYLFLYIECSVCAYMIKTRLYYLTYLKSRVYAVVSLNSTCLYVIQNYQKPYHISIFFSLL